MILGPLLTEKEAESLPVPRPGSMCDGHNPYPTPCPRKATILADLNDGEPPLRLCSYHTETAQLATETIGGLLILTSIRDLPSPALAPPKG